MRLLCSERRAVTLMNEILDTRPTDVSFVLGEVVNQMASPSPHHVVGLLYVPSIIMLRNCFWKLQGETEDDREK